MKEYLIRRKDKDFCFFHVSKYSDVLHPSSVKSKKIEGWGEYRIKVEECEIAFSFEDPGIQISFENCEIAEEEAETIVSEICQNVENEIGTACYWIQIAD